MASNTGALVILRIPGIDHFRHDLVSVFVVHARLRPHHSSVVQFDFMLMRCFSLLLLAFCTCSARFALRFEHRSPGGPNWGKRSSLNLVVIVAEN